MGLSSLVSWPRAPVHWAGALSPSSRHSEKQSLGLGVEAGAHAGSVGAMRREGLLPLHRCLWGLPKGPYWAAAISAPADRQCRPACESAPGASRFCQSVVPALPSEAQVLRGRRGVTAEGVGDMGVQGHLSCNLFPPPPSLWVWPPRAISTLLPSRLGGGDDTWLTRGRAGACGNAQRPFSREASGTIRSAGSHDRSSWT